MLPFLPPVKESSEAIPPSRMQAPPSPSFRPAKNVVGAKLATGRGVVGLGTPTLAQKAGLRYEEKVQRALSSHWPTSYLPSPWIEFRDESGFRYCQPDGILRDANKPLVIFEVKVNHCADAYYQLFDLYYPVSKVLFKTGVIRLVEIVNSFDPTTLFPHSFKLISSLDEVVEETKVTPLHPEIMVLPWKL